MKKPNTLQAKLARSLDAANARGATTSTPAPAPAIPQALTPAPGPRRAAQDLKRCVALQPADLDKLGQVLDFMAARGHRLNFSKAVQLAIRAAVVNDGLLDALAEIRAGDGRRW